MSNLVGQTLGKYQLVERLGRGGMADVYKSYQPGLDRYVAVKVLHPHLAEEEGLVERFRREAKAVAALHHPSIVQVFDFDIEDQNYYMVMEFIKGQTLKAMLTELASHGEVLGLRASLDMAAQLADGLDYAHGEGMIHRDIKPANVLMRRVDRPVLSDFGIARILGASGLTASGAMIGTPAYMSPEQGRGEPADERSDIYALGIVLYEMLTGRPPYDADTPYAVILKHVNDPIPMPREWVQGLPEPVEAAVLKALAKDPAHRFETASAMRDTLRTISTSLDDTPLSVSTPPSGVTMSAETLPMDEATADRAAGTMPGRPARRKLRWPILAGAGLLAAILAAAALLFATEVLDGGDTFTGDADTEPAPAIGQVAVGEDAVHEAQRLVDDGWLALFQEGEPDRAVSLFTQAIQTDPNNVEARLGRTQAFIDLGDPAGATEDLNWLGANAPEVPEAHLMEGIAAIVLDDLYNPEQALEAFTRAIELNPGYADAYYWRGRTYAWDREAYEPAVEDLIHAIEIDPENADYHVELGSVYRLGLSDYDAALREYQSGYEVSGEPWRLEDLMSLQMFLGDLDGALATTDLRISREPDYLPAHLDRAYVLLQLGELDEAEAITTPGLESDDEYSRARAVYLMGLIATERGEWERAVAMLNDAAGYEPWTYDWPFLNRGEDHAVDVDLARAHLGAGNVDAALEHLDRAEAHDEGWFLPYYWRGVVMTEVGNLDAARTNFAIALDNLSEESAERWRPVIEEALARLG
jgi:tetratricopeptide (TPR) repeat protein